MRKLLYIVFGFTVLLSLTGGGRTDDTLHPLTTFAVKNTNR